MIKIRAKNDYLIIKNEFFEITYTHSYVKLLIMKQLCKFHTIIFY